jgi:O-acetylserine/cysteine efflux transporter
MSYIPPYVFHALLVTACWGGNYVAARFAMQEIPPLLLLCLRFICVAVLLLPFFPRPVGNMKDIGYVALFLGVMHFPLMFIPIYMGLDVSISVISSQLGVPFSCLLGIIFYKEVIGRWRALGMLISFLGIIIICGSPRIAQHYVPFIISCVSALAWAMNNMVMKRFSHVNMLGVLAWMSLLAAPPLLGLSLLFEEHQWYVMQNASVTAWLSLTYTVVVSTIIAYGLWFHLMSRYPVNVIVPYSLLVPIFGISFAQFFFQESLTAQFIIGGLLTIIGVSIIVLRSSYHAAKK